MEGSRENNATLPILRERKVFGDDPFVLIDVGCSGGLSPVWRQFGNDLIAFAFDPQRLECKRLQEQEANPRVEYVPSFVGLPSTHEFVVRRSAQDQRIFQHYNPWNRLSLVAAARLGIEAAPQAQPILQDEVPASKIVGVADFVKQRKIENVDFIKIDVDGTDLDVLLSSEDILRSHQILGFAIEVNWTGSHLDTDNTFHNIDRNMRRMGFSLVAVTQRNYSRADLPAPFVLEILAQTRWGQPIQGDAIYLRDAASEFDSLIWEERLSAKKLLKLVALYDIFALPDLAAELLVREREALSDFVDVDKLLDALTPPLVGRNVTYREYVGLFRNDPSTFMPSRWRDHPAGEPDGHQQSKNGHISKTAQHTPSSQVDTAYDTTFVEDARRLALRFYRGLRRRIAF